ncbi:fibrinogen C domain-containing protein 1 [Aplysia californica]|uniref:Fibrinogen C domain-containing protein 1 n=1 Tax=Aplysia californica TaxID=6500 RepID=A0ABM1AA16_APLCA|nr:fibrinogen C domain-containing protein 1 [Aplysia californica]
MFVTATILVFVVSLLGPSCTNGSKDNPTGSPPEIAPPPGMDFDIVRNTSTSDDDKVCVALTCTYKYDKKSTQISYLEVAYKPPGETNIVYQTQVMFFGASKPIHVSKEFVISSSSGISSPEDGIIQISASFKAKNSSSTTTTTTTSSSNATKCLRLTSSSFKCKARTTSQGKDSFVSYTKKPFVSPQLPASPPHNQNTTSMTSQDLTNLNTKLTQIMDTVKTLLNNQNRIMTSDEARDEIISPLGGGIEQIHSTLDGLSQKLETCSSQTANVQSLLTSQASTQDGSSGSSERRDCPGQGFSVRRIKDCSFAPGKTAREIQTLTTGVQVVCDSSIDGGGWMLIQRRIDGTVNFYRNWDDYKRGFGHLTGEFWLGNEILSRLTSKKRWELRVDMVLKGKPYFAQYAYFKIQPESLNYALLVGGYSGTAGDSLSYHSNNGFSTEDRDNDRSSALHCARSLKGAWWYNSCHTSNLNALYGSREKSQGLNWMSLTGDSDTVDMSEMMIRLAK